MAFLGISLLDRPTAGGETQPRANGYMPRPLLAYLENLRKRCRAVVLCVVRYNTCYVLLYLPTSLVSGSIPLSLPLPLPLPLSSAGINTPTPSDLPLAVAFAPLSASRCYGGSLPFWNKEFLRRRSVGTTLTFPLNYRRKILKSTFRWPLGSFFWEIQCRTSRDLCIEVAIPLSR